MEQWQWIYIRDENRKKPILLMLHGGPGTGQIGFIRKFQKELEQHFVVVQWDQRGAGLSYSKKISLDSMNIDQFVHDTIEVTTFIMGKHDLTIPYEPTENFFNQIIAPEKNWTMFENSAHSPLWEEPKKFERILLYETETDCI